MTRLVIAGGPRTGKTTLAHALNWDVPIHHTDHLIHLGWSEASEAASRWMDNPGPWIVEGVAAVRALRKWLERNPEGKPCDGIAWLDRPVVARNDGQERMARGCETVWLEIRTELALRGVAFVSVDWTKRCLVSTTFGVSPLARVEVGGA